MNKPIQYNYTMQSANFSIPISAQICNISMNAATLHRIIYPPTAKFKQEDLQNRKRTGKQPAMDLSRDKNAEEMKWSPLEMGAAMQAHGA